MTYWYGSNNEIPPGQSTLGQSYFHSRGIAVILFCKFLCPRSLSDFHTVRAFLSGQGSHVVGYKHRLASLSTLNNILAATSAAFFTPFKVCKRFRSKAMQRSVHSPCTAFKPRNR